jgi:hypothetical protein
MPDNTSAGDGLPSGSRPSAQPEAVARFQSYEEYLAHLDRSPIPCPSLGYDEQLWLASFTEDCRYIKRYICMPTNQPAIDVEGSGPDTTVLSCSDFLALLQMTDEDVFYRVVIAASNHGPSPMMQDILGLGLDLEPEIFDYITSTADITGEIPEYEFPLPWFKDAPALRIGSDVLCILKNTPERRSKTGTHRYNLYNSTR